MSVACGGGSGVDTSSQIGKPCSCNLDAATPGDYMCSSTSGPCSGGNVCVNGTCTVLCSLDDAGAGKGCPDGSTCERTAKSNLAVYCAFE